MPGYPAKELVEPTGLEHWMAEVVRECEALRQDFSPDTVHDLRVALRRCRSVADGFMVFDPLPDWKLMKDEGKKLFRQLGELRDTHIMAEWLDRAAPARDEAYLVLNDYLMLREGQLQESALAAVREFNRKRWSSWIPLLSARVRKIPMESMAFQHLALERWTQAYEMHRQAMRNRSHISFHRLRIALKKFRYTLENFLPARHELWGEELRRLQDLLGEMHDLHVLWSTCLSARIIRTREDRLKWSRHISQEIQARLRSYRESTVGENSLFLAWRFHLPGEDQIRAAALARMRAWSSFRDPEFSRTEWVSELTLQIYDGIESAGLNPGAGLPDARWLLEAASIAHDAGRMKAEKDHQIASYRLIRKLAPPLGCTAEGLGRIAAITRFHCGDLPRHSQKALSGLPENQRGSIVLLAGILRLANALADNPGSGEHRIGSLTVERVGDVLHINVPGYSGSHPAAERIAAARHLLEITCGLPILIR